jgi:glycosyltransferase involved in cell wall biosynthesis
LRKLGGDSAVSLLPTITRFDLREISPDHKSAESGSFKAIFVGGFDYPPNCEAIYWFIKCQDYLSPELLAALEVVLVGRAPPEIPAGCKIKFEALGFVDDLFAIVEQCQLAIIPIVSGSGVKIKSLTLLSSGLPVVTTSEGISGIKVRNEIECLIADSQADFAQAIERLFTNPDLRQSLQSNAYAFISAHFSAGRQNDILREIIGEAVSA